MHQSVGNRASNAGKENVGDEANMAKGVHQAAKASDMQPFSAGDSMNAMHGSAAHAGSQDANDEDAELLALL